MPYDDDIRARILAPSIPGTFVLDMLEGFRFRGGDFELLLQRHAMSAKSLSVRGFRVSVAEYAELISEVRDELKDESLGFFDEPLPLKTFAVFCSGLSGKHSLQEVVSFQSRFYKLFTDQFHIDLSSNSESLILTVHIEETQDLSYRFIYQSLLVTVQRLLDWLFGVRIIPTKVTLSTHSNGDSRPLEYLFEAPVLFEQSVNQLLIPLKYQNAPVRMSYELMDRMLREGQINILSTARSKPFTRSVKEHILLSHRDAWPEIEQIAESLRMTPNLLWRKLKKEGSTFTEIRDELKRDWALQLVQDMDLTVEEIAGTLKFADTRGLQKAFNKWTGMGIAQYRESLQI